MSINIYSFYPHTSYIDLKLRKILKEIYGDMDEDFFKLIRIIRLFIVNGDREKVLDALEDLKKFLPITPIQYNDRGKKNNLCYYNRLLSWSILDRESINYIASFLKGMKAIEIGSGCGLLCTLLQMANVDIQPTDDLSSDWWKLCATPFTKITDLSYEKALNFSNADVLLLVWSERGSLAEYSLRNFKGRFVISIQNYTYCASDEYFDILARDWKVVDSNYKTSCFDNADFIVIYEKN
jgi:hypothetical protein